MSAWKPILIVNLCTTYFFFCLSCARLRSIALRYQINSYFNIIVFSTTVSSVTRIWFYTNCQVKFAVSYFEGCALQRSHLMATYVIDVASFQKSNHCISNKKINYNHLHLKRNNSQFSKDYFSEMRHPLRRTRHNLWNETQLLPVGGVKWLAEAEYAYFLYYLKKWRVVCPNSQYLNNIGEEYPD